MKIAGISVVRNAADIIVVNLLHHLHTGIDIVYLVDNGSSDGTGIAIDRVSKRFPVVWSRDDGPFRQSEMMTELARTAARDGADWIVPIDADEMWWSVNGDLHRDITAVDAAVIECEVIRFVQRRDVHHLGPDVLLTMTRRAEHAHFSKADPKASVESATNGFVECRTQSKVIVRAGTDIVIHDGSHNVDGVVGERKKTDTIACLHAPLRSRAVFRERREHGSRLEQISDDPAIGWQSRWWKKQFDADRVDLEWAANSYSGDFLNVHGQLKPLMVDTRLHDCAKRWMEHDLVRSASAEKSDSAAEDKVPDLIRILSADQTALHANLARSMAAITADVARLGDYKTQIDRSNAELDGLKRRLHEALDTIADRDATIARLRADRPSRADELDGSKQQLHAALEAINGRDVVIADLEARLGRIKRSIVGRCYLALSRTPFFRRIVRRVTALE